MNSSPRNSTMDIFKALACIGVVFIHIRFPGEIGTGVRALGCFGVPLFFCVSGYWLSSKEVLDPLKISQKLKHIVHLILGAELVHFLFTIILQDLFDPAKRLKFLEKYFVTGWIERWLITNAPPVYAHLWFLYALALIYLFILLFIRCKKQLRILSIITPFLLLGIVFFQEFSFLKLIRGSIPLTGASITTYWAHTVLFRAMPFFLLGFLFREFSNTINKIPGKLPIFIFSVILCEISAVVESYFFNTAQFYIGNILATILIMFICNKYPNLHCKPLEYLGGNLYTWIYICHVAVHKTLGWVTGRIHIASLPAIKWMMPIAGLIVSIIIAVLIDKGSRYIDKYFSKTKNMITL